MDSGSQVPTLPGWYRDPWNAGQQRYWDGQAWTGHIYAGGPTVTQERLWAPSSYADVAGREGQDAPTEPDVPYFPESPPPLPPAATAVGAADPPPPATGARLHRWVPLLLI